MRREGVGEGHGRVRRCCSSDWFALLGVREGWRERREVGEFVVERESFSSAFQGEYAPGYAC